MLEMPAFLCNTKAYSESRTPLIAQSMIDCQLCKVLKNSQTTMQLLLMPSLVFCGCRCVGWAQCSKCPRPESDSVAPPGAEKARCAPYPVKSCPVAGAHCPTPLTCCKNSQLSHDCREFLPFKCPQMPAINCAPNVPASGWSVLSWKPSPAAFRTDPKTQMPSSPCR